MHDAYIQADPEVRNRHGQTSLMLVVWTCNRIVQSQKNRFEKTQSKSADKSTEHRLESHARGDVLVTGHVLTDNGGGMEDALAS